MSGSMGLELTDTASPGIPASFKELPVIDVGRLVEMCDAPTLLEDEGVAHVARELDKACTSVGFFFVVNHGVPQSVLDEAREVGREFFALPEEEKQRIALTEATAYRGYQKLGMNVTQGHSDIHEGVDYFRGVPPEDPLRASGSAVHGLNPWPESPAAFRPALEAYVAAMLRLGRALMRGVSLGLGVPPTSFEEGAAGDPYWILRVIGYPPQTGVAADGAGSVGCGEHTDYGLLTFVNQDPDVSALQVRNRDGDWIAADPLPGSLVVNIGDMLKVWTNGRYQSTPHRVLNTGTKFRVSVPFFYEPNFEAVVAPIPDLVETNAPLLLAVRYGDHVESKVFNNFV